ncbi:hypothetical protein Q0Z83_025410 [Actinoplanes sichuanensis]|uniref:Uncharacterized protein n=1 Tax=Actinoplanes sichuanensis TaxID=512349 RepID=A0ABW4A1V1_9ACTN|nr:hypothetical protein [Actinoplanes sichuanensis]BEL04350.1 hypothetical protein Q0Z83_025410 [Actinoplanes sichuanensis]
MMPEIGFADSRDARVGHIDSLILAGRSYHFRFTPNPLFPEIPLATIEAIRGPLSIDDWEFQRTHWAAKVANLYRIVQETAAGRLARISQSRKTQ